MLRQVQPPPLQDFRQLAPAQSCAHLPPAQLMSQSPPAPQVCTHEPPSHEAAHVERAAHVWTHLPAGQSNAQVLPAAQLAAAPRAFAASPAAAFSALALGAPPLPTESVLELEPVGVCVSIVTLAPPLAFEQARTQKARPTDARTMSFMARRLYQGPRVSALPARQRVAAVVTRAAPRRRTSAQAYLALRVNRPRRARMVPLFARCSKGR